MTTHMIEAGKPATKLKSEAAQVLFERGLINQCTDIEALDEALGSVTAYAGFDATAASLHVGHLMPLMTLRWLQKLGHRPIVVLGGGTSQVGDPSFRNDARPLLDGSQIAANIAGIRRSVERLVDMRGPDGALLVDNAEWLTEFRFLEFLRDYGSQFTVNRMLTFDSVKSRIEAQQPLTVLEFCYMMLQAVDFLELARRHDCTLQMGGSDQWGNILSGVDITRRLESVEVFALTSPLLTTASGAKMGKTAAGAVWLNDEQLSAYEYWQYWRNTEDADVERFLKLFTVLPMDEIARLAALQGSEINEAKKILATEATALIHGREKAEAAAETARKAFEEGEMAQGLPTVEIPKADLEAGLGILNAFVTAGLCASNGDVRRNIKGGAVRINDKAEQDDKRQLGPNDVTADGVIKLSLGKKKHVLLQPV